MESEGGRHLHVFTRFARRLSRSREIRRHRRVSLYYHRSVLLLGVSESFAELTNLEASCRAVVVVVVVGKIASRARKKRVKDVCPLAGNGKKKKKKVAESHAVNCVNA